MAPIAVIAPRPRNAPPTLPPEELPDVGPMVGVLDAHLQALLARWNQLTDTQKQQLVAEIQAEAASGDVRNLPDVPVDVAATTALLTAAMVAIGPVAARQVAAEAAAQGVHLAAGRVADEVYAATAEVAAKLAAEQLRSIAVRAALQTGPGTPAVHVAGAVEAALQRAGDAGAERTLGAALHGAMNTARIATFRDGPVGAIYASEVNDKNTCEPCREVNGRWLCNTDDLVRLDLTYPAGAYGGYLYCLGGDRCRGTITGVWRKGGAGS